MTHSTSEKLADLALGTAVVGAAVYVHENAVSAPHGVAVGRDWRYPDPPFVVPPGSAKRLGRERPHAFRLGPDHRPHRCGIRPTRGSHLERGRPTLNYQIVTRGVGAAGISSGRRRRSRAYAAVTCAPNSRMTAEM